WFSVQELKVPLEGLFLEYSQDNNRWDPPGPLETSDCPGAPLKSWDIVPKSGAPTLAVRLKTADGKLVSQRSTRFQTSTGGLPALTLRPDLPGEGTGDGCTDRVDGDGDGLVDGADPECGAPSPPNVDLLPDPEASSCAPGASFFVAREVDAAEYYPGALNPRAGWSYLVSG